MSSSQFNLICRLCVKLLETEKVSPIFRNKYYADKVTLPERIKYCSSLEVDEDDGLPNQICSNCLMKLNQSFSFRNQCVLADLTLKHLKNATFELQEIPNLFKIDTENQIINLENENFNFEKHILKVKKEIQNEFNIDEFDNSKNGRHKKNINKSKSNSVQRLNAKKELIDEASEILNEQCLKKDSENVSLNFQLAQRKVKEKIEKVKPLGSTKSSKLKKMTEQKQVLNKKEKAQNGEDFQIKTEKKQVEVETVENDFDEVEGGNQNINEIESTNKISKKNVKKSTKPKIIGIKKKKGKRSTSVKEKPSSYTCDYCKKIYPSEGGWRYHIHTMHNENYQPFICDLCGQAFKVKKNLEGHKNSIHFHLKLHLCDLCGRGFASKYALKVHKIWHNDEKNFTCDICGTKFRTRGKMNTHRSIHGGPKKFMCHICSRDFRWKKDFEIHMRTHTGEKPFKCSHCGKAFASLTNMKKHERNHVEKLKAIKNSEVFDSLVGAVDDRLYRDEILDFGYGAEDVRNINVS